MSQLIGVGANHTKNKSVGLEQLNEVDLKNAEDIIIIAIELCYEAKLFDWTVLNPVNFTMITILEHA